MSYGNSISLLVGGLGGREGVVLSYPSKKCEMDRLTNEKKKKKKKGETAVERRLLSGDVRGRR